MEGGQSQDNSVEVGSSQGIWKWDRVKVFSGSGTESRCSREVGQNQSIQWNWDRVKVLSESGIVMVFNGNGIVKVFSGSRT